MFVFVSCVSQITNIIFMLIIPFFINLAWWEEYIEHQPHDHHVIKLYVYQPWRHLAWWKEHALSPSHILPSWWTDLIFRVVFFGGKTKMNFHNIKICFPASFLSAITLLGMPAEVYTQVMKLLVISFSLWITLLNQIFLQRELSSWRCWFSSQWPLWWWPKSIFPSFIGFRSDSDPLSGFFFDNLTLLGLLEIGPFSARHLLPTIT